MLFQQQMRLPIDSEVLPFDKQEDEQEEGNLNQKIQSLLASREKAFKEAKSNIAIAQKIHKETYDRNTCHELEMGVYKLKSSERKW